MSSKTCLNCNQPLLSPWSIKFCSRSCAASFNNRGTIHNKKKLPDTKCRACSKSIIWFKKFCNHTCQRNYREIQRISDWLKGSWSGTKKKYVLSETVRNYLFKQAGYSCPSCGWDKKNVKTGKVPLQIDHKDGNYKNNSPSNVRVLCPNCHALTETFGALNTRGKGRRINGDM